MSELSALPIDELKSQFERHDPSIPLVISAPTGSGKSTQIPRWCAARAERHGKSRGHVPEPVLVIEPRRVACRSLAQRVADLQGCALGTAVGYTVRDEDRSGPETLIRFVTTGVALRLWKADHFHGYSAVIIDEFHERNLEIDLLLALCQARPGPQLIVMSATFAADTVAQHLHGEHLRGTGRQFDVDVQYHPAGNTSPSIKGLVDSLPSLIDSACEIAPQPGGDVLVFLPGKGEIIEVERLLTERWRARGVARSRLVLPLHGGLSLEEQARVFHPSDQQRVILSTNVAETSVTVPKVSVVIDSGLVRRTRYDRGRGALVLTEIAQDSAEQRRGRAGRLSPGICLRMWARAAPLKPQTPPEIHREALTSLVLAAGACEVKIEELLFLDPPKSESIRDAQLLLQSLGALDENGFLNACGHVLFELGLDAALGRWLVEGIEGGPIVDLLDLVSALSIDRPLFYRGLHPRPELDLRRDGCDAVGLIRAVRTPLDQAHSYHINPEALRDARSRRSKLIKALSTLIELPSRPAHRDDPIDRRTLALALLRADPRSAYVRRERRQHEAWCGSGPEMKLSRELGLTLIREEFSQIRCDALIVLEQHAAVKGGRHADHLITSAMPVPLAWLRHSELGEERIGEVMFQKGEITIEVERVFAKRILETRTMIPTGAWAREAITRCILSKQLWPSLCDEIEHRLNRRALSEQLLSLANASTSRDPRPSITDREQWILLTLETLGVEEVSDLSLLSREDLLPAPLDPREETELDKAFPTELNMSDARYLFHYQVPQRRVIMEQVSGSRRSPPRVEWLPKCGGFEIRFKQGQHDSALRPRRSAR